MESIFQDFFLLGDPNVRWVLAGTILLSLSAGILGCFTILRRRALVGDAVAHAVLPGVALAFIVAGDKNPIILLIGAVIFGWIAMLVMESVILKTKISTDTSIGMVLSVFFGLGVVLLSYIQNSGNVNQSGLDAFLFGNAASMLPFDIMVFSIVSLIVILLVLVNYKEFKLISFDPAFGVSTGLKQKRFEFLMATLLVLTITAGLQAVGVVLMASMLIIPAAAARYWTDSLSIMLIVSGMVGVFAAIVGSFVSFTAPSMPTGPWMVVAAAIIFVISLLFSPSKGLVRKSIEKRKHQEKAESENILKRLYKLGLKNQTNKNSAVLMEKLSAKTNLALSKVDKIINKLIKRGYVQIEGGLLLLTEAGNKEAERVIRAHRLWELYLTERLNLKHDHVHDDAESMEHFITPELEEELMKLLGKPEKDPHQSQIPY